MKWGTKQRAKPRAPVFKQEFLLMLINILKFIGKHDIEVVKSVIYILINTPFNIHKRFFKRKYAYLVTS